MEERKKGMALIYRKKTTEKTLPLNDGIHLSYVGYADKEETSLPSAFHAHQRHLELQYVIRGAANISIDGGIYHVQAGDFVIYNKGVVHDECADPEQGFWFYNCGLRGLALPGLEADHLLRPEWSPQIHTGPLASSIESLFSCLYQQMEQEKQDADLICYHLLYALLYILLYQVPYMPKAKQTKSEAVLSQVKDYMDHHFMEELSIADLSARANMSVSSFAHQFKKRSGFAPIQYIIRRRIGLAQNLLIRTDLSITAISLRAGFDNVSYFNNQFKKFAGLSPQNYRKLKIGKSQFKRIDKICNI